METDEGIKGHAFLGGAFHDGSYEAPKLIRFLKPKLMGRNPLERETPDQESLARNRDTEFATQMRFLPGPGRVFLK